MTISGIAVSTAGTGVNTAVAPGTPAGVANGDLVLIFAAIRNAGVGTIPTPTGWVRCSNTSQNFAIFGRFWDGTFSVPVVSFTGGVALADTYARSMKITGAGKDTLTEFFAVQQVNSSAANIAYPALDMPGDNCLAVMALWKQDDCTSIATPAGWTAQGLTNMTAGDDMLVALYTQIQTTESDIASGAAVVTGGVAAVSNAQMLVVKAAPTVGVTVQSVFPPRNQIVLTGLLPGDTVDIYRVVAGMTTVVRGGSPGVVGTSLIAIDSEMPFGATYSYQIVLNGTGIYTTSNQTSSIPSGKVVLSDAINGNASEFVIVAWDEKGYEPDSTVFPVGGRNVVVSGPLGQFEGTMDIFFDAYSSTENFKSLLAAATEGVLQLRAPLGNTYQGVDCYLSVISARERRFSQDGSDGRREWTLQFVETDDWSPGQAALGFTLQDIADTFAGQTLFDYSAAYSTLLQAALGDYS